MQALRLSETLYKAGDKSFADDYRALTKDADPNVVIQAMLTANLFKLKDAPDLIKAAQAANPAKGVAVIGERLLAPPAAGVGGNRRGTITPAEEKRLQQGSDVYGAVCFACHAPDGLGAPLEGAPAGTMMAPPLAGSPRVQGHRDYVIKVLLRGMIGPLDGRTYRDVMVPMDNTDEWIAGVASYVRTSFGNNGDLVTPADVARVRAEIAGRKTPWTAAELEASLPRPLDALQFTLTASHGGATAPGAATLRGWHSGVAQMPGMWFQIELREPALVTEIQFDSPARWRPDASAAARPRASPGHSAAAARVPVAARLRRARIGGRQEVEQAGCDRRAHGIARDDRVPADARAIRPHHADRQYSRRAGMVDPQPARLRSRGRRAPRAKSQSSDVWRRPSAQRLSHTNGALRRSGELESV